MIVYIHFWSKIKLLTKGYWPGRFCTMIVYFHIWLYTISWLFTSRVWLYTFVLPLNTIRYWPKLYWHVSQKIIWQGARVCGLVRKRDVCEFSRCHIHIYRWSLINLFVSIIKRKLDLNTLMDVILYYSCLSSFIFYSSCSVCNCSY